jgi:riboflavin kinase/FMN adenylyltransferase
MTFIRVNHLSEVDDRKPTFVTIGSFDGVHLGHQEVLRNMVAAARVQGVRSSVLTFFPHPKRVLLGLKGRHYLSTLQERVTLLANIGIDLVITHPFNEEVRRTKAADFVEQLCHYLDMRQLWGGNFALGYKREGDVAYLSRLGRETGYTVQLVDTMVARNGELVSSSRVRRSLEAGDVEDVSICLGRPYCVSGIVIMGDQRGRTIGFPTANLDEWEEQLLPANGVYATHAWVGEQRHLAATNVGVRPTVNGRSVTVETHLLDFDGDLHGQNVRVEFLQRVRSEQKFSGLDDLGAQIKSDVSQVRQLLS